MASTCLGVRDQLEALVDGELEAPRAQQLRDHLASCSVCRAHHTEASSLPARLGAFRAPEPPPTLVQDVLRRVCGERLSPLRLWAPLGVEAALFLVTLWYVSGFGGLYLLVQRAAADAGAAVGLDAGQTGLPPAAGDVFLLLVCGLLLVTTLYHLVLLSRQGLRLS